MESKMLFPQQVDLVLDSVKRKRDRLDRRFFEKRTVSSAADKPRLLKLLSGRSGRSAGSAARGLDADR